ncbi:MAG: ribosome recycling factor [Candidatus Scalindua sp. AMX11]|nr:MAG: ribosome recycling factor [Candidatus Scalindua sp.]NOG85286.1 ribosome recycling factor [Planctomycetota bacterium]RZV81495.1 MAG: ribosome recycling factor [Candidatus Scalindua sp. SCAELEC01]TDE65432.1 MAG: ribosome recycling factor [Candidatus Scalindua sp. AMX11]GJQ59354.1 MAG: ribosome-recycling factor [Candidatus Scalindua sp.]
MSAKEIQEETKRKMEKTIEMAKEELKSLRTGRASPGIVENVKVDYYGSPTPLKQIANITAPEAQLVVISPFDPSIIKDIEKAIQQADLGLTTHSDGKTIRIPLPPLSEDRRKKIVAQVKDLIEEAKISVRNIRRDANKHVDKEEKASLITEDESKKAKERIQEFIRESEATLNGLLETKTAELMKV